MPPGKRSLLVRLLRRGKQLPYRLFDRTIDLSDKFLMGIYRLPRPIPPSLGKPIARCIGDISWWLRDFPSLPAWKLITPNWTIIFVGRKKGLRFMCHLFYDENVEPQELERVAIWKLPTETRQWLTKGADLVVCELSRLHPNRPRAPITFTVPTWINQVLTIPESLETVLAGTRREDIRRRVNKLRKAGFTSRFSQSKHDFDDFYHRMYVPFVKTRHGDLASFTPYEVLWQWWFTSGRGGLILAMQDNKPVAGVICHVAEDTCYSIEAGVLEGDADIWQQGINGFLNWCVLVWGQKRGAKLLNMGGTRPWRSNGPFKWKARWGGRVVRRQRPYDTWTFLARNPSTPLQDRLNELGLISEVDGKFYSVWVNGGARSLAQTNVKQELIQAQKQGLDGLLVVSASSAPRICS